jgi:hypothetical protein
MGSGMSCEFLRQPGNLDGDVKHILKVIFIFIIKHFAGPTKHTGGSFLV